MDPMDPKNFIDPKTGRRDSTKYYAALKAFNASRAAVAPKSTSNTRAPRSEPTRRAVELPRRPRSEPTRRAVELPHRPAEPPAAESLPRAEVEALTLYWKELHSQKDYAAADLIRSQLRAIGIEAEKLAGELEPPVSRGGGRPSPAQVAHMPARAAPRAGGRLCEPAMPRKQVEALAMQWREAKSAKDYNAADAIRSRLRAIGVEAEDLAREIEMFGFSDEAFDEDDGAVGAPPTAEPDPNDPLAYREHRTEQAKALMGPTELAGRHKDGGTGGLLALNYSIVPDLPEGIGFTVLSGKAHANAEALTAYKEAQAQAEEETRREIAARNAAVQQARRAPNAQQ